jgi:hypothetical protein
MSWGRVRPAYQARAEAAKLDAGERESVLARLRTELALSPVLVGLKFAIEARRGRFYLEQGTEAVGRITPLSVDDYALEKPHGRSWVEVARGTPEALVRAVANDSRGDFHGLGAINKALVKRGSEAHLDETGRYQDGDKAGAAEMMHFRFGVPLKVLVEPKDWYTRHRHPAVVEVDPIQRRLLVEFTATSWSGESLGGRCIYLKRSRTWECYTLRPSQSANIEVAVAWLEKRKWVGWS